MLLKQGMTVLGVGSTLWLMSHTALADTVLLDPATLAVGATVGEFLVVKESCPDPSKTNCQATEKIKYITAVAGRTGKIEFDVNLTDNFELDVNVNWASFVQQAITLFKADNDNANSLYVRLENGSQYINFNDESRENYTGNLGWQSGNSINNVELSAKNGTAYLNINGTPFKDNGGNEGDTVALDTSTPFVKLVIAGIKEADRLFEVTLKGGTGGSTTPTTDGDFESGKQAGIQQCVGNPASCGITVSGGGGTCTGGAHATYTPASGEVYIPLIDVPGPFGGIQTYEVYLLQQPLTFTFDLDTNRIIPK
jgi:hypothetical protein